MWKIVFKYRDGGKCDITGKGKSITGDLAVKYYLQYGVHSDGGVYQEYPKNQNEASPLIDVIKRMGLEESIHTISFLAGRREQHA